MQGSLYRGRLVRAMRHSISKNLLSATTCNSIRIFLTAGILVFTALTRSFESIIMPTFPIAGYDQWVSQDFEIRGISSWFDVSSAAHWSSSGRRRSLLKCGSCPFFRRDQKRRIASYFILIRTDQERTYHSCNVHPSLKSFILWGTFSKKISFPGPF